MPGKAIGNVHEAHVRRQPYVQVAYRLGPSGALVAELPAYCPGRSASDGCEVKQHGVRERIQGPSHALVVARCVEHGRSFTLYPPGWPPYGRRPLCHVSPAGTAVRSEGYASTLFGAVQDAARGVLWPRAGAAAHEAVHRTQGRHIELARVLLGVGRSVGPRLREALATALGVALLVLCEASRAYEQARTWCARARVLMDVLQAVGARREQPELWFRVGHVAGLWGQPSRWDPGGSA